MKLRDLISGVDTPEEGQMEPALDQLGDTDCGQRGAVVETLLLVAEVATADSPASWAGTLSSDRSVEHPSPSPSPSSSSSLKHEVSL